MTALTPDQALQRAREFMQAGDAARAASLCVQILQAAPERSDARDLLVTSLTAAGRPEEAARLLASLGAQLLALGRHAQAEPALRTAAALAPALPGVQNNLGVALNALGRREEALPALRAALAQQPHEIAALNNLGRTLLALGQAGEAGPLFARALAQQPGNAALHANHVLSLQATGQQDEARRALQTALAALPDAPDLLDAALYVLAADPGCSPEEYVALARRYGAAVSARATPFTDWPATALPATPLRVGLVSGDLRTHPVGYFLENVLAALDPARIRVTAWSTYRRADELTARLRAHCAAWHDIAGLDDATAAQRIRDDGTQVLIDLSGHTTHNRLPLFARKPAPVQVTWLGFSASTGVPAIDAILVDPVTVPPGAEALYTERPWRLPRTRVCFTPPAAAPEVAPLPALARGHLTLGCFQNLVKIGDPVLAAWARILAALPAARLHLQNGALDDAAVRDTLRARLLACGIDPARVTLAGRQPYADYLAAHAGIDFILDTFPFPGGTTTCEALWMGVPTLTLAGRTLVARYGAGVLHAAGLHDWIAADTDDYVARAVQHAGDLPALAALRAGLRSQAAASPLFDAAAFAGDFTDALQALWATRGR